MNKSKAIVFQCVKRIKYVIRIAISIIVLLSAFANSANAAGTEPQAPPLQTAHAPNDPSIQYVFTPIATGLSRPLFITHAGDDRIFIAEQSGQIKIVQNGAVLPKAFLDISPIMVSVPALPGYTESGLLGLAFEPNYASTGRFYVYYNDKTGDVNIARYTVSATDANVADPDSGAVLLTISHRKFGNHNGGWLGFGPDNFLYAAIGDGGSGGDPDCRAANPQDLLGKMLRLNVVGQITYTTPISNMANAAPQVWGIGLRNPWRNSFDRQSGEFYIADVGQNAWEEVNAVPANAAAGINFGWSKREGKHDFANSCAASAIAAREPVQDYAHADGNGSITGGYVYRGASQPWLNGNYFYGDASSGRLWALWQPTPGTYQSVQITDTAWSLVSFGEDKRGELYLADLNGAVYRLNSKFLTKSIYLPFVTK